MHGDCSALPMIWVGCLWDTSIAYNDDTNGRIFVLETVCMSDAGIFRWIQLIPAGRSLAAVPMLEHREGGGGAAL